MKNKLLIDSRLILVLFLAIILISNTAVDEVLAAPKNHSAQDIEKVIDGALTYKQKEQKTASIQELIDSELVKGAGRGSAEWLVIALSQYKASYDYSRYLDALDAYVEDNDTLKATDLQRISLAYSVTGSHDDFIQNAVDTSVGEAGIMSYIYGLILLDTREYTSESYSRDEIIDQILSLRLKDGGWALGNKASDVDITAMAIQALAPYYEERDVKAAVDDALELLSELQLDHADYQSWGSESCESTAQVLTALSALHIDCQKDKRFIKNKKTLIDGLMLYRNSDNSFSHKLGGNADNTATIQAVYSLVAYWRQLEGLDSFYTFSNTEPSKADEIKNAADQEQSADTPEPSGTYEKNSSTEHERDQQMSFDYRIVIILVGACILATLLGIIIGRIYNKKNKIHHK